MKIIALCFLFSSVVRATAATDTFVHDFYAAYSARDPVRISQFYASDATFVDPSFELDLKGPDQIRDLFAKVFPKYEALDWEIAHTTNAGDTLVVEGTLVGKIGSKTVRVPFVSRFQFRGDKIAAQRDLFDVLHYFVQLDAIQSPFAAKPAATPSAASTIR